MAVTGYFRAFEHTKLYDLLAALPLAAFYAWNVWRLVPELTTKYYILRYGYADVTTIADALSFVCTIGFLALLTVLLLARRVPTGKSRTVLPRLAAVLGTFFGLAFLRLPRAELPLMLSLLSSLLILIGAFFSNLTLAWLGRSFSIMPEARRLVTTGPYALVRHPVYLFEEISLIGVMLQFRQPWSFLLLAVQFAIQLARIHYEEDVLTAAFPEYRAYAQRTWCLIPGLY